MNVFFKMVVYGENAFLANSGDLFVAIGKIKLQGRAAGPRLVYAHTRADT